MKTIQLTATKHMRSILRDNGVSQDISGQPMKRSVSIRGKNHQHKVFQKYGTYERNEARLLDEMPPWVCDIAYQTELVDAILCDLSGGNALYERCIDEKQSEWIIRQLENKMEGYIRQDREKREKRENSVKYHKIGFELGQATTLYDAMTLLQKTDCRCHYCGEQMYVMFRNTREPKQWTLDRINNHKSHSLDNVVVACYECNIRRRQRSYEKFKQEFAIRQFDKLGL